MSKAARETTETRFKDELLSAAALSQLPLLSGVAFWKGDLIPLRNFALQTKMIQLGLIFREHH